MKPTLCSISLLTVLCSPVCCLAAPEEIQVYMDDLSAPGKFGLDVHNNYVVSGDSNPAYPGALPAAHQYRLTPEFYYGLTDNVELGMYVLSAFENDGTSHIEGGKVRIKYIAPHDAEKGMFWGVNLEAGRTNLAASEVPWNAELKGIWGFRTGEWTFALNPNIDWSLSSGGGPVTLDVDGKLAYSISEKTQIGVELYSEFGPVRQLQALNQNSKTLYAALDHDFGGMDLNAGIGRGLTSESDKWVIKFIIGTHF